MDRLENIKVGTKLLLKWFYSGGQCNISIVTVKRVTNTLIIFSKLSSSEFKFKKTTDNTPYIAYYRGSGRFERTQYLYEIRHKPTMQEHKEICFREVIEEKKEKVLKKLRLNDNYNKLVEIEKILDKTT